MQRSSLHLYIQASVSGCLGHFLHLAFCVFLYHTLHIMVFILFQLANHVIFPLRRPPESCMFMALNILKWKHCIFTYFTWDFMFWVIDLNDLKMIGPWLWFRHNIRYSFYLWMMWKVIALFNFSIQKKTKKMNELTLQIMKLFSIIQHLRTAEHDKKVRFYNSQQTCMKKHLQIIYSICFNVLGFVCDF